MRTISCPNRDAVERIGGMSMNQICCIDKRDKFQIQEENELSCAIDPDVEERLHSAFTLEMKVAEETEKAGGYIVNEEKKRILDDVVLPRLICAAENGDYSLKLYEAEDEQKYIAILATDCFLFEERNQIILKVADDVMIETQDGEVRIHLFYSYFDQAHYDQMRKETKKRILSEEK